MALLGSLEKSIQSIIHALIEHGAADRFNMPSVSSTNRFTGEIGFRDGVDISWVLRDQPYSDLYAEMLARQMFHIVLPDGGIMQFMYKIRLGNVEKHRLAFYPAPNLRSFDADTVTYLHDAIWGHVVSDFQMPVVVRFDFDSDKRAFVPVSHSLSHLTLGQYPNCRIPVSGPIPPWTFASLILRNFYRRCFESLRTDRIFGDLALGVTLDRDEENASHFVIGKA